MNAEQLRLREDARREKNWKRWGPYLSERQWGTVREDYSELGTCWEYFPHDHARSRAYRWGEDGLLGFTDRECRLCFALALWNRRDPILKERLFGLTENESNSRRLWGVEGYTPYVKDAFHEAVVGGRREAVNPARVGTKAAAWFRLALPPGGAVVLRLRLRAAPSSSSTPEPEAPFSAFEAVAAARRTEADEFYRDLAPGLEGEEARVHRQACAGLLWNKQFYHYSVRDWLRGDKESPLPPTSRLHGRNSAWTHLFNRDVLSMPDKWEFPATPPTRISGTSCSSTSTSTATRAAASAPATKRAGLAWWRS